MLARRSFTLIVLACTLTSGFRVRTSSRHTKKANAGQEASAFETADAVQAPASTPAVGPRAENDLEAQFIFDWFTNRFQDLLAHIGGRIHSFVGALLDANIVDEIVDYIIDSKCDKANPCPVTYAECVSPFAKSGHKPISTCSDITSKEGTGLFCLPGEKNAYGYKPCWPLFSVTPEDRDIERACESRCPSSLHWSDLVRLPDICGLFTDTLCPALRSDDTVAWRNAAKEFAKEAMHPDAWIPMNRATGRRSFNGWMALVMKTVAGVGLALPGTADPSVYRGMFPEEYKYKDCLAANNNEHETCKHHVEYDENPALKREYAYQVAVAIRGYNYENSCRGEEFDMGKFGAVGLGIEQYDMSNWCKQSDKRPNVEHDIECVGIAGNVPLSRPKEPVGNLEQSSCDGANWGTLAKVYDADLGVCVGKDAYSPLKVWKHHGLLSDSKVGLYMTEEGPNKVKLTLSCRGSEIPDVSTLPEALTSDAFDENALWKQIPSAVKDWLFSDFNLFPRSDSICYNPNVQMHNGFQNMYKEFKAHTRTLNPDGLSYLEEVAEVISAKLAAGKEVDLFISGHSLGGAMAAVMAYDVYCHRQDYSHRNINSVLTFSKDRAVNKATGPLVMTFGEAPVWWGKRSAAAFAADVPASVHMRVNTCGQETKTDGDTFFGGDLVGLAMDHSGDDDQGFRKRADGADFQCAWVSKTFFARASSTGLDNASMEHNSTVISPEAVNHATSSSCQGLLTVGGVSLLDSAIFCHFGDRYMEGVTNYRGVENNFAVRNSTGVARKSLFHQYTRPKAETRATCQDLGTYSYDGETYRDVPRISAEYELRNVVTDLLNIPVGELFDRLAERTGWMQRVAREIQAKGEHLKAIAERLFRA